MPPVLRLVRGNRKCESWISAFTEYTKGAQSNDLFRRWSAIGIIAAALERKVWILSQGSKVYPNLYIFLVSPPGVGKTRLLNLAGELYTQISGNMSDTSVHKIARTSLTKAALIDQLAASVRVQTPMESFNSMAVISYEFGALVPNYDADFLNALIYFFDCIKYDEQRRGTKNDPLIIDRPQLTMIACTNPSYLVNTMPPGAWDQGFLARVIMAYNSESEILPLKLNEENPYDTEALRAALLDDLREIACQSGKLQFTKEAGDFVHEWNNGNGKGSRNETSPSHPRLQHYNTRRSIHMLKLCMVAAADTGNDKIDIDEVKAAINWLYEAEKTMSGVFMAMASGGIASVVHDCWHYAKVNSAATNNMIPTSKIYTFLQGRLPSHEIRTAIEIMVKSEILEHIMIGGSVPGFRVGSAMASL